MHHLAPLLALALAHPVTAQTTWTVSRDPAAAADFEQIQAAIGAASDGDVVLVDEGSYVDFYLTKALRIVGTLDPSGTPRTRVRDYRGPLRIHGIRSDGVVVVSGVAFGGVVEVDECDGVVVLEHTSGDTYLRSCADVRTRRTFDQFVLEGPVGWLECADAFSWLRTWLRTTPGSEASSVLVSNPRVRGCDGYASSHCFGGGYSDGGPAISAGALQLVITGRTTDYVLGGAWDGGGCWYAWGAPAIVAEGTTIRHGGARVATGDPVNFPEDIALRSGATAFVPARRDPSLRLVGFPTPGAPVELAVDGEPGDYARIEFGTAPANVPSPGSPVPRLVTPGSQVSLGTIPPTGTATFATRVPPSASPGDVYWVQASAVTPSGVGRRTNSLPVVVR